MEKTIYKAEVVDRETGEILSEKRVIKRTLRTEETFFQTFTQDIGVLLGCTKGQIDLIICLMKNDFIEFDTNEIVLNSIRRQALSECSGIKLNSLYSLFVALKKRGIIVQDEKRKEYLNPKLFFKGSEIARSRMFELHINYSIEQSLPILRSIE